MPPKPVIIYSQPDCPPCEWVKDYLRERGVAFEVRDVTRDAAALHELTVKHRSQSTPTTVIGEEVMIGFDPEWLAARLGGKLAK